MSLALRYMTLADIPQVVAIDRLSFDLPWSERSYSYEISEATYSHMVVLEMNEEQPTQGWRRWLNSGRQERRIVGYGGLWHVLSEAHISTIAVHPTYRGRGWGEILLAGMVRRSITLQAELVVLEVRVSNTRAQNLYHKYEFETAGVKPRYYRNNDEDAYDMRLDITSPEKRDRSDARFAAIQATHPFHDTYTMQPPRKADSSF
jgi:ribosomal-protein-alanine N-acetyltransferase